MLLGEFSKLSGLLELYVFRVVRHGLQANWNEMNRKMKKRNGLVGQSVVWIGSTPGTIAFKLFNWVRNAVYTLEKECEN